MQANSQEKSTSDDLTQPITPDYKAKVDELVNKTEISKEEIKKLSCELRNEPKFEFENGDKLLTENSFEIVKKDQLNPIFILNLLNIINIINFIWICTKKNIKMFHEILFELNIMFSYLKNKEQIEYVLLASIPVNYYESIAKYGKKIFKKDYKFDHDYLSSSRNISQIGLVYQENTIVQLCSILNNKQKETPKIMYYINHDECIKLFQQKIFNQPMNFLELDYKQGEYFGYNEIDYSFFLEEDIEISQSYIMNMAIDKGEQKNYLNFSEEHIKFSKNTNIFIETKTKIEEQNNILDNLKQAAVTFSEAYNSPAYREIEKTEKSFKKEKYEYYLLYNHEREDGFRSLKNNNKKDAYKDAKVIFNSGYVQIYSIVSLQNQIRTINNQMAEQSQKAEIDKKEMRDEMEKQKKEMDDKLANQKKEMDDKFANQKKEMEEKWANQKKEIEEANKRLKQELEKIIESQNEIINQKNNTIELKDFQVRMRAELGTIKLVFETINPSDTTIFSKFSYMNKKYLNLFPKIIGADNAIINTFGKIIGKKLKGDDKKDFFSFLELLNEKITSSTFTSCYYESFKKILVGPYWKDSDSHEKIELFDIFSNNTISKYIYDILKLIVILECDKGLENYFFEAILYYVSKISETDKSCYALFYLYQNKEKLKETVCKFILSLNLAFKEEILKK